MSPVDLITTSNRIKMSRIAYKSSYVEWSKSGLGAISLRRTSVVNVDDQFDQFCNRLWLTFDERCGTFSWTTFLDDRALK